MASDMISRRELLDTLLTARNEYAASMAYAEARHYEDGMISIFREGTQVVESLMRDMHFRIGVDFREEFYEDPATGYIYVRLAAN